MFNNLPDVEIRELCRTKIESLEFWLRRIVDQQLSESYGNNYIEEKDESGNELFSSKLKKDLKLRAETSEHKQVINASTLGQLTSIFTKEFVYKKHFHHIFLNIYPSGYTMAKFYLDKIEFVRNRLAHANPISIRNAEQTVCYSNDIIDSIKEFYNQMGTEKEFVVPSVIQITDSFGNKVDTTKNKIIDLTSNKAFYLRPGDILKLEILADPSFNSNDYRIEWWYPGSSHSGADLTRTILDITIEELHVGEDFHVNCQLISHKNWHRHRTYDDFIILNYKILPPP